MPFVTPSTKRDAITDGLVFSTGRWRAGLGGNQ